MSPEFLRDDPSLQFDYIVHVSSVDWPDDEERFEVVYEFYSIRTRQRIRLKTRVPESDAVVDSLTDIWKGADFMEREVYDMMGIRFRNHPDLRRILMPDEYEEGIPAAQRIFRSVAEDGAIHSSFWMSRPVRATSQ